MLEKVGCRVDVVANGKEGVRMLELLPYDLVLMDCQMPEMDGYEATSLIRAREGSGRRTPIIAMTANTRSGDREDCLAAGMDGYIAKPLRRDELARMVSAYTAPAVHTGAPSAPESSCRAALLHRLGGSEHHLKEFVGLFVAEYPALVQRIRDAIASTDADALRRAAHELKGAALNMEATGAANVARELECRGQASDLNDTADLIVNLETELGLVEMALTAP
jgi:CheY-like chemotaxis protein